MLFNSLSYFIFLTIVFSLYWILPDKYRNYLILISSYLFYGLWDVKYLGIIMGITIVTYIAGWMIEERRDKGRVILSISIILCLMVLVVFKYLGFMVEILSSCLALFGGRSFIYSFEMILPVGISFYTFQAIGYVFDVYRGDTRAEESLVVYAGFIAFFPQLVAGPIERSENLLPAIRDKKVFSEDKAIYGLKLMIWGYFKKLVIADGISVYVNQIFGDVRQYSGLDLAIGVFFFTIQIYCDFSGYSDIAIGSAKLLGIDLMANFKSPYFATSLKDFWKRWHISLSGWFRDYVYIPLGGNKGGRLRGYINLVITFLLSGLWHGAGWTYIAWGGSTEQVL